MINDHTAFRTDWMPFAGRHQSGYGIGGIPAAMQAMMQEKRVQTTFIGCTKAAGGVTRQAGS
jgi:acyl-CoA reductase-like NAD-dependent aldehyde dehydrogenase